MLASHPLNKASISQSKTIGLARLHRAYAGNVHLKLSEDPEGQWMHDVLIAQHGHIDGTRWGAF